MGPRPKKKVKSDNEDFVIVQIKMIKSERGKTEKSQLYYLDQKDYWLPTSQVKDEAIEGEKNPMIRLVSMPLWLAVKQELDLYIE